MRCGAVIAAAGTSRRMGELDKTLSILHGRPVIEWVLDAMAHVEAISETVIITHSQNDAAVREVVARRRLCWPVTICPGGDTRQASVAAGVRQLSAEVDLVLIHDAARPLATPALIKAVLGAGAEHGAVVAAVPVTDTIKQVGADGVIRSTPNRDELWAAQTPQVFRRDWLDDAYRVAVERGISATDEASLLELAGIPVRIHPGSVENLKLTTPTDLAIAETLLAQRIGAGQG